MELENPYWLLATAALGALLGVCALLATAKFVRRRVRLLSPLVRAHGALFAVMMGAVAVTSIIASVKDPPTNQMQQVVSPRLMPRVPLRSGNGQGSITETNVADGWRMAETREGCEIVGRAAFDAPQMHMPWLLRGGYRDKTRIAPYGWSFPWRDGMLHGITVLSKGEIRPNIHTRYFPPPFEEPLAVVPSFNWRLLPGGVSNVFWHAVSPSNSLVVTWENSPVSRDVNSLTNFQAELFADGSFVYRYDDRTVGYAPVFPFDWDDDGLENSVDPEPLVAGPGAHGTNAEWYNVVCSNVYEAAEGGPGAVPAMADTEVGPPGIVLSPRAPDVNTNAYYFVAVVAERGPAPIYFTGDRASRLGNPVLVARGGETNHVPLLMGVGYAVTSTVPLSLSAPSNASVAVAGINDGRAFSVKWPLSFDLSPDGNGYAVDVQPFDPGGDFSWTSGPGGGVGPRLLSGGSSCTFAANGNWVGFMGCGSCGCGGCAIDGTYTLEGAAFTVPSLWCGCTAVGSGFSGMPQFPASVSVSFDKAVVFYEDAYTNAPNVVVGRHSTTNVLLVSAYGGGYGGLLRISQQNMDKLRRIGGANINLPYSAMLPPMGSVFFFVEYEAAKHSDAENDIAVDVSLTPIGGSASVFASATNTVVEVQLEAVYAAPSNTTSVNRHIYGVYEPFYIRHFPALNVVWEYSEGFSNHVATAGENLIKCPLSVDREESITLSYANATYKPLIHIIEPQISATVVDACTNVNSEVVFAGAWMELELYAVPMTVSFRALALEEVPCTTGALNGYFEQYADICGTSHTREHGAGTWWDVDEENRMGGDRSMRDRVIFSPLPEPYYGGTLQWDIPVGWNVKGTSGEAEPFKEMSIAYSVFTVMTGQGTVSVRKFGHTIIRGTNNVCVLDGVQLPN